MLTTLEDEMAGIMSFAALIDAVAVTMEQWIAQHREFIVETCFKNGDCVVKTQRIFCKHFNNAHHGKFPCRNTI
jgi:hypothetical protein